MSLIEHFLDGLAPEDQPVQFVKLAKLYATGAQRLLEYQGVATIKDWHDAKREATFNPLASACPELDREATIEALAFIILGGKMMKTMPPHRVVRGKKPLSAEVHFLAAKTLELYGLFLRAKAAAARGEPGGWQQLAVTSARLAVTFEKTGLIDDAKEKRASREFFTEKMRDGLPKRQSKAKAWRETAYPVALKWREKRPSISQDQLVGKIKDECWPAGDCPVGDETIVNAIREWENSEKLPITERKQKLKRVN